MRKIIFATIMLPILLSGCSDYTTGGSTIYNIDQAKVLQKVYYGTVESAQRITIKDKDSGMSTGIGAIAGGASGYTADKNTPFGTMIGAAAGGIIGSAIGNAISRKPGCQYDVLVTSPMQDRISVVQGTEKNRICIQPGTPVRVIIDGKGKAMISINQNINSMLNPIMQQPQPYINSQSTAYPPHQYNPNYPADYNNGNYSSNNYTHTPPRRDYYDDRYNNTYPSRCDYDDKQNSSNDKGTSKRH